MPVNKHQLRPSPFSIILYKNVYMYYIAELYVLLNKIFTSYLLTQFFYTVESMINVYRVTIYLVAYPSCIRALVNIEKYIKYFFNLYNMINMIPIFKMLAIYYAKNIHSLTRSGTEVHVFSPAILTFKLAK